MFWRNTSSPGQRHTLWGVLLRISVVGTNNNRFLKLYILKTRTLRYTGRRILWPLSYRAGTLTWDAMGMKLSKHNSSKIAAKLFTLVLKFPLSGLTWIACGDFWNFDFVIFYDFCFSKFQIHHSTICQIKNLHYVEKEPSWSKPS